MVSAICPNCHILVVEANSSSFADLGTAANEAVTLGARQESNSYGSEDFSGDSSYCSSYYQHAYVAVTVSSVDVGPGISFPADCTYVIGVGGTTLPPSGAETPWPGAGGGCTSMPKSPWQISSVTGCSNKAVSDVSAVADPNTGVYVYDTYVYSGWYEVGGTSASSPIIASVYALAGNAASTTYPVTLPWTRYPTGCLFEVPAGTRYTYQAGLGSPDGIGCF
jgi:subtilase family serine protease